MTNDGGDAASRAWGPLPGARAIAAGMLASGISALARLLTGAQPRWVGCRPAADQRVYFANHSSHADFVLIWSSLPPALRSNTRPVAGSDYWDKSALRRFVIRDAFNAVLIDRVAAARDADPLAIMRQALHDGASLIIFPEGTRNVGEEKLLPLKAGIYHLARECPAVELVPVWIQNLNRVLPKGEVIPLPLLCTVNFGAPMRVDDYPGKTEFLDAARQRLLALAEQAAPNDD